MSGRHSGGTRGTTFLRGYCRSCGRVPVDQDATSAYGQAKREAGR